MGVEIETLTPGDGGNNRPCLTASYSFLIHGVYSSYTLSLSLSIFSYFQDRRFRRRGSASWCTMSVSGEAVPLPEPLNGARKTGGKIITLHASRKS